MSNDEIKTELLKLTDGMLYISESDYEIDVQERGKVAKDAVLKKISEESDTETGAIETQDANAFFNKTIKALDPSDEFAAAIAEQYKTLYAYLKTTFKEISVYRAGKTQVHIFITCVTGEGECFTLHTVSVET